MKKQILKILNQNCCTTAEEIAVMLNADADLVRTHIKELEEDKIILGYKALINWEKTEEEPVSAIIELKVTPELNEGFDKIAEKIYKYPEIKKVCLMSGGYDIAVFMEGKTMKEIALFVAEKLAPMNNVVSTGTHFVLRTYKDEGVIFNESASDKRGMITL